MRFFIVLAAFLHGPSAFALEAPAVSTQPVVSTQTVVAPPLPRRPLPRIPRIMLDDKDLKGKLDKIYDSSASGADSAPVVVAGPATDPLAEPEFDESWAPIARGLWAGPKAQQSALAKLSARYALDEESLTGLSVDSPEALRLLATAIHAHKGGVKAFPELTRELKLVADLKLVKKTAFAASLVSALPVYVAISASHASHFTDAQAYFKRMTSLLDRSKTPVSQYIARIDPEERYAAAFLLRLHAYDALVGYLNRRPAEAKAVAAYLISEKRPDLIRERAAQIEAFTVQLAAYGRDSHAIDQFGEGLLDQAKNAKPAVGRRAALLLKLNEGLWPRYKGRIAEAAELLPEEVLADERLTSPTPYSYWPEDRIALTIHFPRKDSYADWLKYFTQRGYAVGKTGPEGVELTKRAGSVTVSMLAKMYTGDEEGFLGGPEKERFLKAVSRDLRDPAVQGVVVRTHAQFFYPAMFGKSVTKGKFWLDGSCRGSWYAEDLEKRCPTCSPVGNAATGMGEVTNPALYAIVEGLAARKDWAGIGKDLKAALPKAASRFMGPWTPRFHTALDLLKQYPVTSPPDVSSTR